MDGFDDLLAPSQRTLEANPFADPFSKRSGSPDPWASFSHERNQPDPYAPNHEDEYGRSTTPTEDTPTELGAEHRQEGSVSHSRRASSSQDAAALADPLDSVARTAEVGEPEGPKSPGFKESVIPNHYSQTETIRTLEPEELVPAPAPTPTAVSAPEPSDPPKPTSPTSPRRVTSSYRPPSPPSSPSREPSLPSAPNSFIASPTPSTARKPDRAVVSPLDHAAASMSQSFSSLALGGESTGGWPGAQSGWVNDSTPVAAPAPAPEADDAPWASENDELPTRAHTTEPSEGDANGDVLTAENGAMQAKKVERGPQPLFVITVDDPQKVGDPIRSFTMYTVHTKTTSTMFQKSSFSVLRRYSDFLWLYETLSINNPGVVVPPVPEKNPFGRFDDQFVQQRRLALEKCIQKTANHPVLCKDADLKLFLESDSFALDIKHRKAEIAHERGGLMASIGQSLAGPRFYETDEWFDRQKSYLDSLESQLRGLVKAIELVAKHRSDLSVAMGEFANTIAELATSDVGKQLAASLAQMADVEHKAQDLQQVQAQQDMITILSTVDEYARLINSVRLAFSSRVRTYHTWQSADSEVRRVKQAHERNRVQGRIPSDRLGHSLSQIAEAERRALEAKHDFDHASKLIKSEVARFEHERIEDFKDSLVEFLEGMISRQKEVIGAWENYQQSLLKRAGGGGPMARPTQAQAHPPAPTSPATSDTPP